MPDFPGIREHPGLRESVHSKLIPQNFAEFIVYAKDFIGSLPVSVVKFCLCNIKNPDIGLFQ